MKKIALFTLLCQLLVIIATAAIPFDNFEDGDSLNQNKSKYYTFTDGASLLTAKYNFENNQAGNIYSAHINWEIKSGAKNHYTGFGCNILPGGAPFDLKSFQGIRFRAKGNGEAVIQLPSVATQKELNHFEKTINLQNEWQNIEIPFSRFQIPWGTAHSFDAAQIFALQISFFGQPGVSGDIYIDDIEFYTEAEGSPAVKSNPVIQAPKVNQVGYLPDAEKWFSISFSAGKPDQNFTIVDAETGAEVYSGKIENHLYNDTLSTGESVVRGNFSAFTNTGRFKIKTGVELSTAFTIENLIYQDVYKDALRTLSVVRCGTEVNDELNNIHHATCHQNDKKARGQKIEKDFTGGWHNASDFGKWTHMTCLTIADLLWLYEFKPDKTDNYNIPESGNLLPDLLDEAKWGLTWLLKMQNPDGSVFHKVDSEPAFSTFSDPGEDTLKRYASFQGAAQAQLPSTIDAADFTAVMLQAARVFAEKDPTFAEICKKAGLASWTWISNNPVRGQSDIYYTDNSAEEELLWARAEYLRSQANTEELNKFITELLTFPLKPASWYEPHIFAFVTLCKNSSLDNETRKSISKPITLLADSILAATYRNGYVNSQIYTDYFWGSNEYMLNKAMCLLFAFELSEDIKYKNGALAQLNYLFGLNSLNKSFVTGHGENSVKMPYHWTYLSGSYMPGWISGGPNYSPADADYLLKDLIADGTPPAKCYIDNASSKGSWASNEGQISENAALAFVTGYLTLVKDTSNPEMIVESNNISAAVESEKVLNIFLDSKEDQKVLIFVSDVIGKRVIHQNFEIKKGKTTVHISDCNLSEVVVIKAVFKKETKSIKLGNIR